MDKRISDSFDVFQWELDLPEDSAVDVERIKKLTLQRIHGSNTGHAVRRRVLRTFLIAAVIACFLSVTAYAAAYFNMHYRVNRERESKTYHWSVWDGSGYEEDVTTDITPGVIFSFESSPEGTKHYIHADWLPSEPTEAASIYNALVYEAVEELKLPDYVGVELTPEIRERAAEMAEANCGSVEEAMEAGVYRGFLYQAMSELGIERGKELWVSPEIGEKVEELAAGYGLTPEEAKYWISRYTSDDGFDIPYLIEVYNAPSLYETDLLIGVNGNLQEGAVEMAGESEWGDWQELRFVVRYPEGQWPEGCPLQTTNYIFRFNTKECYLLEVCGSLELDTLARIMDQIRVWDSGVPVTYVEGKSDYSSVDIGRG